MMEDLMRILGRDREKHGLLDTVAQSVGAHDGGRTGGRAPKAAAIAVAGLAGLTAASAAISSLRRRAESQSAR